jgi:DNA-directed RNA polymerase subunit alpha
MSPATTWPTDIGSQPVASLGLSNLALGCLTRVGITTIAQLVELTAADLRDIRNLGNKSINAIQTQLGEIGLSLKGLTPGQAISWGRYKR